MGNTTEKNVERIPIMADLPNLLKSAAAEIAVPGVTIGFGIALDYINTIVDRALEIKDQKILACLYHIGFIICDDEEKEKFQRIILGEDE